MRNLRDRPLLLLRFDLRLPSIDLKPEKPTPSLETDNDANGNRTLNPEARNSAKTAR